MPQTWTRDSNEPSKAPAGVLVGTSSLKDKYGRPTVNPKTGQIIMVETELTPEQVAARAAQEAAALAARPMDEWIGAIMDTDKHMPRWLEDHIENAHGGVAGNTFQQQKYDAKKALRAKKPVA